MVTAVPIDNMVLIEIDNEEKVSAGGIILTASESEYQRRVYAKETGVILSMGSNAFFDMGEIKPKVGDRVMFKRYSGVEATFESVSEPSRDRKTKKQRVMNDKDIYLILKEDKGYEIC
jgi:co-chaperonin GroES (HSP10)